MTHQERQSKSLLKTARLEANHPELYHELQEAVGDFIEKSLAENHHTPGGKKILKHFKEDITYQPMVVRLKQEGFTLSRNLVNSIRGSLDENLRGY